MESRPPCEPNTKSVKRLAVSDLKVEHEWGNDKRRLRLVIPYGEAVQLHIANKFGTVIKRLFDPPEIVKELGYLSTQVEELKAEVEHLDEFLSVAVAKSNRLQEWVSRAAHFQTCLSKRPEENLSDGSCNCGKADLERKQQ